MRKRIIGQPAPAVAPAGRSWLDVERLAQVEITSEDPTHPIESALRPGAGPGWQAASPGEQTIRLLFDAPLSLRRIHLVFREDQHARTQEFALRWSPDGGQSYQEIVRQQYIFSPPSTTHEVEDYAVNLDGVTALELQIIPDIDQVVPLQAGFSSRFRPCTALEQPLGLHVRIPQSLATPPSFRTAM